MGTVEEEIGGVQFVIAQEFKGGAMESLATRLGYDVDHAACGKAKFRAVIVAQNSELADGIHGGENQQGRIGANVEIVDAVDQPEISIGGIAIHRKRRATQ